MSQRRSLRDRLANLIRSKETRLPDDTTTDRTNADTDEQTSRGPRVRVSYHEYPTPRMFGGMFDGMFDDTPRRPFVSNFDVSDFERVFGGSPFGKQPSGLDGFGADSSLDVPPEIVAVLGLIGQLDDASVGLGLPTRQQRTFWSSGCARIMICNGIDDFVITLPSDLSDLRSDPQTVKVAATEESIDDYWKTIAPLITSHNKACDSDEARRHEELNSILLDKARRIATGEDSRYSVFSFSPEMPEVDIHDTARNAHMAILTELKAFIERHGIVDDEKEETEAPATETSSDS